MNVQDGRGLERAALGRENIEKVRSFFDKNPGSTQADCLRATGLSRPTVAKAIKIILTED